VAVIGVAIGGNHGNAAPATDRRKRSGIILPAANRLHVVAIRIEAVIVMAFLVNNWMLELIVLLSGGMLLWPFVQKHFSSVKDIGTVHAIQLINRQNAVVLDVREAKEFEGGHVPNAMHIPLSALSERGSELAKLTSRPVVTYCDRGQRGRAAGGTLATLGFSEIYQLAGGFRAWKEAGLPVAK
jgi:rhodanese-related sulfurtransferase